MEKSKKNISKFVKSYDSLKKFMYRKITIFMFLLLYVVIFKGNKYNFQNKNKILKPFCVF